MKKRILLAISALIICVLAVSMIACTSINNVLEVRFASFNVWKERPLPEVCEYNVKNGSGDIIGSYTMTANNAVTNATYHVTKLGITLEKQEVGDAYTFKAPAKSFVLTQSLVLSDGTYSMETTAYMTASYCLLASYTKIVKDGKEEIVVSKNVDDDKYYYTKYNASGSSSDKIKLDQYKLEGYYDNTLFYFVLRSIPKEFAGYKFKLIDTDNNKTYQVITSMDDSNPDYTIITAKTEHKILGEYNKVECHVSKVDNKKILKIIEGEYTYEAK